MATDSYTSSKIRTMPTSLSGLNDGFQDIVPDQENVRLKEVEEHIIESYAGRRIVCGSCTPSLTFARKVVAEIIGTFFLIFAGCGSVVIDKKSNGSITHLGVSLVWGMAVMIIIYAIGHISGAHLNPSVTLASAAVRRFPWDQIEELAGLAVGTTVCMNVIIAGPISGASMNPARTIGSAVSGNKYTSIWIYMVAPVLGAIMGALTYNMIRLTDRPLGEITETGSFLKSQGFQQMDTIQPK